MWTDSKHDATGSAWGLRLENVTWPEMKKGKKK